MKDKKFKLHFIVGVVTFNRCNHIYKNVLNPLLSSLDENIDYLLIFADGNSIMKCINYLSNNIIFEKIYL